MPDYTRATGSSGTMMIRDTGSLVEFWLKAGSGTFAYQLGWSYTLNGSTVSNTFRFESGGAWQRLGVISVSTNSSLTFRINATGTNGLGGPSDLSVSLNRSTVPPPPAGVTANPVSDSVINVMLNQQGDGGSPITAYEIWASTNPTSHQWAQSGWHVNFTGLSRGTTYYFWGRALNANGWSGWSVLASATTWDLPQAPDAPVAHNITQTSVYVDFNGNGLGGAPSVNWQIGYGTSQNTPSVVLDGSVATVTNLTPGGMYYFRARAVTSVGIGPWSAATLVTLVAGAMINHNGTWKRAVPYVRVAGVWKLARPWVKQSGTWKEQKL